TFCFRLWFMMSTPHRPGVKHVPVATARRLLIMWNGEGRRTSKPADGRLLQRKRVMNAAKTVVAHSSHLRTMQNSCGGLIATANGATAIHYSHCQSTSRSRRA